MQNFSKDEFGHQLPRCVACLHDFDRSRLPCPLPCKHVYCSRCLKRLQAAESQYCCLYDGNLASADSVAEDLGLYNRIDFVKKFVLTRKEVAQDMQQLDLLTSDVNYAQVPCPLALAQRECTFAHCRYDHSTASLEIAQRFSEQEADPCWECEKCLLIVARKLQRCPVCESAQTSPLRGSTSNLRLGNRDAGKPTNGTLDLSTFEEKGESADGRGGQSSKKGAGKPSTCCVLQ